MAKMMTAAVAAIALAFGGAAASAATVNLDFEGTKTSPYLEDGFVVKDATLDSSNHCVDDQCIHLNSNDVVTLERTDGGMFSLLSLVFNFQGNGGRKNDNSFAVTDGTTTIQIFEDDYAMNTFWTYDFASIFEDVMKIQFLGLENANVRIDNLALDVDMDLPEVPLPASGLLLVGALGAMGALRRRKAAL